MKLVDLGRYLLTVIGLINEMFALFYESSHKIDKNLIKYNDKWIPYTWESWQEIILDNSLEKSGIDLDIVYYVNFGNED